MLLCEHQEVPKLVPWASDCASSEMLEATKSWCLTTRKTGPPHRVAVFCLDGARDLWRLQAFGSGRSVCLLEWPEAAFLRVMQTKAEKCLELIAPSLRLCSGRYARQPFLAPQENAAERVPDEVSLCRITDEVPVHLQELELEIASWMKEWGRSLVKLRASKENRVPQQRLEGEGAWPWQPVFTF